MLLLTNTNKICKRNLFLLSIVFLCVAPLHAQDDLYTNDKTSELDALQPNNHGNDYNQYNPNNETEPYYHSNYESNHNPNYYQQKNGNIAKIPYDNAPAYTHNTDPNSVYNYADPNQNYQQEEVVNQNYPSYSIFYSPWFYPSVGFGWGNYLYGNILFDCGIGLGLYGIYNTWGWGPWGYPYYGYYPWYYYSPYYPYPAYYSYYNSRPVIYRNGINTNPSIYNAPATNYYKRSTYKYAGYNTRSNTSNMMYDVPTNNYFNGINRATPRASSGGSTINTGGGRVFGGGFSGTGSFRAGGSFRR